ncbi:MAG: ABC transporter permease [Bacillota bacterium]|jgi:peptide/nickel transport system permease protein|nr:ABC transporter permease [Bacillota bacterium]HOB42926.1 ABC transporter permease [Bacillota bacterium]HOK71823.1 ABC transporter permease [Bacillota bacterium]HOL51425.1 ABC transporter permease [Bacillota bacterium]HOO29914.1 ABC transporter permease [Bacillota bacterium]
MSKERERIEETEGTIRSEFAHVVQVFFRHKLGVLGLVMLVAFVAIAIFAPVVAPCDPYEMDLANPFLPPGSPGHILGTDNFGRDMLSRLIYGSRISLLIGIVVVSISSVLGSLLGMVAGYYGGWVDALVMRLVEVFYSFPFLILVIAVMAILGPSIFNVMWVLGVVSWPLYARLVRAQVMALKSEDFIKAASALGCSDARIMFRHILPNVLTPVIVSATLGIPSAILSSASLGFLGFGVQPPTPEWGAMVSEAKDFMLINSNMIIWPGLCIFLVVLSFNFVGDALRDALDPRLAKQLN